MHSSVYAFFRKHVVGNEFIGKNVIEVGSMNVNGGLREEIEAMGPCSYMGTDMRAGPGVDYVAPAADISKHWGEGYFGALICTEMLEHAEDWRASIDAMKAAMAPGAVIYLTTRGPGYPRHGYPDDFWRFTVADMKRIFADFEILVCEADPEAPGVFLKAKKLAGWKRAMLDGITVEKAP